LLGWCYQIEFVTSWLTGSSIAQSCVLNIVGLDSARPKTLSNQTFLRLSGIKHQTFNDQSWHRQNRFLVTRTAMPELVRIVLENFGKGFRNAGNVNKFNWSLNLVRYAVKKILVQVISAAPISFVYIRVCRSEQNLQQKSGLAEKLKAVQQKEYSS